MNAKARAKEMQATAAVGSGSEDDALTGAAAAADEDGSGQWRAGCEARPLDLSSPAGVYRFSESFLAEGRPLHVIINCADDHHAIFHAPPDPDGTPGWERTAASNHLGPFLLTQLLLDQVVGTMRADARRSAALAKRLGARSSSSGGGASRGGGGGGGKRTPAKADAVSPDEQPLQARPYPAPLGRCVTLGLDARLGLFKPGAAPPACPKAPRFSPGSRSCPRTPKTARGPPSSRSSSRRWASPSCSRGSWRSSRRCVRADCGWCDHSIAC
jgi:hypothetical protein